MPVLRRAAEYLRKSTDHQRYSIDNQKQAIAEYALCHDIDVVRSYVDDGRSGVLIRGRKALQELLSDVKSARADFDVILVYDISRWGRFQDADEGAYYEFVCKLAGVSVEYCAEQFENNGSVITTLLKGLKRVMAGEYSRDLSLRIARSHRRLAGMGFHQGGRPNYGLRRLLVDENRKPKFVLQEGQYKNLHSDRIVLVPGPKNEVLTVREIFRLFVTEGASIRQIIRFLGKKGIRNARGNIWSIQNVIDILSCEKYAGTFVYCRTSEGLDRRRTYHSPAKWLRVENAIEPIVDKKRFREAQCRLSETWKISDADLLNYLTATWCTTGYISCGTLSKNKKAPSPNCFQARFGRLQNAYRFVGFRASHLYRYEGINDRLRQIDRDLICRIATTVEQKGGDIRYNQKSELLRIDDDVNVRVVVTPYLDRENRGAGWRLYFRYVNACDFMLIARLERSNTDILDYHLLPYPTLHGPTFRFTPGALRQMQDFKLKSVAAFYDRSQKIFSAGRSDTIFTTIWHAPSVRS